MTTATPPRDSRSVRAFADRCFGSAFAHAELARALIELADDELGAGIDPGSVRLMRSTVLDPEWRSRLADWLVAATWLEPRGATPYPLEVVCEHMSRARPRYALRFALLAIERWRAGYRGRRARAAPRVLALLLYTGTHRWRDPEALMLRGRAPTPACLARYEPRRPLLVVDLHRTSPARLATAGSAGLLLRAWRARASRRAFTPALRRAMRGAMALGREHAAARATLVDCLVGMALHILSGHAADAVVQSFRALAQAPSVLEEFDAVVKSYADELVARGRKQGREEGLIQGRRDVLLGLIRRKRGRIPVVVKATVARTTSVTELDRWIGEVSDGLDVRAIGLSGVKRARGGNGHRKPPTRAPKRRIRTAPSPRP